MKILYCCFVMVFATAALHAQSRPRRPNIVLILADDQGWGDLSIHGNNNLHTPNIDGLAQFTRFFVSPVCSPTRAELLTGNPCNTGDGLSYAHVQEGGVMSKMVRPGILLLS